MRRGLWLLLALPSCSTSYYSDALWDQKTSIPEPGPDELLDRERKFRDGTERYHGDPREVAHIAMDLFLTAPWRGRPFRAGDYEFHEADPDHRDWGSYVVRGEMASNAREYRARVKVRRCREIWYAVEVSHFVRVELPNERLEDDSRAPDVPR